MNNNIYTLEQLQSVIDNVPTGISIYEIEDNKNIIFNYHNEIFFQMLGYTQEEYENKTKNNTYAIIHPDDIKVVNNAISELPVINRLDSVEVRILCGNNKYSWFKIDSRTLKKDENKLIIYECFTNIDEAVKARQKEKNKIMEYANDVFNYLYNSENIDDAVNEVLAQLGKSCDVSRVYIFEDDNSHQHCNNTFEWCAKGVTPQIDNLQNISYFSLQCDYRDLFNNNGVFDCSDINTLSDAIIDIVTEQNIKSMLQCSIILDKTFSGYIGFDDCDKQRRWSQHEIDILLIISKIIGVFLKRRKAMKLATENNERLTQIVKSIPGGVAIYHLTKDNIFTTEYVSPSLAKMCGYNQEDFLQLLKNDAISNVAQEDHHIIYDAYNKAIQGNGIMNCEYRVYKKDGSKLLIRLNASLIKSDYLQEDEVVSIYGVHTVVTDYEMRLAVQQEQNKIIMDRLDVAYFGWDINKGTYCSDQFKRYEISKIPIDSIMSNSANKNCVHPEDLDDLQKFFDEKNEDSGKTTVKLRLKMSDGTFRWTNILRFSEHDKNGKLISAMGIFMDVDEEWIEQNNYLKSALKQAEQASNVKTDFLSRVSHDMRTPMNGIIGLTDMTLQDYKLQPEVVENLQQIQYSSEYLLRLVNDTLDINRMELNSLQLNLEDVCPEKLIDNVLTIARINAKQNDIELSYINHIKMFPVIKMDALRSQQIWLNILSNAIKFTPKGGKVEVELESLFKDVSSSVIKTTFRDNGIGIGKDFLPHVFEAFAQEHSNTTNQYGGTGLGMSIVENLVHLMGGSITVESELGKGTTFTMIIPYQWSKNQNFKEEVVCKEVDFTGKKVLLCEDHVLNQKVAIRLLNKKGITVETADNGLVGYEKFQSSPDDYYDAILMDIRMPVMNGLESTKKIRSCNHKNAKTIPIIAMTANAFDEDRQNSFDAGMNAHIAKPIDVNELYNVLSQQMNNNIQ